MTGSIYGYTSAYRFKLVDYSVRGWHRYEYKNWRALDALLDTYFRILNFQGEWENSYSYTTGDLASDANAGATDPKIYRTTTTHTSPATGTFSAYRTANPGVWVAVDQTVFDATSNAAMKRLRNLARESAGHFAAARSQITEAIAAADSAQTARDAALQAQQQTFLIAGQAHRSDEIARRAKRALDAFSPANIALYAQVFN